MGTTAQLVGSSAIRKLRFVLQSFCSFGGGLKKKVLNNPWVLSRTGRGRFMLYEKNKQLTTHRFGELELVDKTLFFICANRRDN